MGAEELLAISNGATSVEEAVARWMSFQDLSKVQQSFKELNGNLDIAGTLRKPDQESGENLYDVLAKLIQQRHALIHQSFIDPNFNITLAAQSVKAVEKAGKRVYTLLIDNYQWHKEFY